MATGSYQRLRGTNIHSVRSKVYLHEVRSKVQVSIHIGAACREEVACITRASRVPASGASSMHAAERS
jgi:hypothetical protein